MKSVFASLFFMFGSLFSKDQELLKIHPDKHYTFRIDKQLIGDWAPTLITFSGILVHFLINKPSMSDLRDYKKLFLKAPRILLTSVLFGLSCMLYDYYKPKVVNLASRL